MALPSFLSDQSVDHEVNGQTHKFYPVSTRTIFHLKRVGSQSARALQALFSGGNDDVSKEHDKTFEGGKDGAFQERHRVSAIDPVLAEKRYQQKQKAVNDLIETLLSEDAGFVLARLIMDSMREAGFPRKPTNAELGEFVDNVSADSMVEMCQGLIAANRRLFAPLEKWVATIKETLQKNLQGRRAAESASSSETEDEPYEETQTTGVS